MGNNITKQEKKESQGWWDELMEEIKRHENDSPDERKLRKAREKRCKYINEVRANWKHETLLLPRLRRLTEEDLHEIGGLIQWGRSFNTDCSKETLEIFPALELYFLVRRDMKERLAAKQAPPSPLSPPNNNDKDSSIESSSSSSNGPPEEKNMESLSMLPELEAWIYSPGDSIEEFKTRLELWAVALYIYDCEKSLHATCTCYKGLI